MNCYAVIDTNVLVAALLSSHDDAATVQVVGKFFSGEIIPLLSDSILSEYGTVLRRKKFGFSEDYVERFLAAIEKYGLIITPKPSGVVLPDMKDLPFYEIVLEKRDEDAYLVTGNLRHFPQKPFVVTARQFLEICNKQ